MGGLASPRPPLSLPFSVLVLFYFFLSGLPRAYSTKRKKRRYPLASVRDLRLERRVLGPPPGSPRFSRFPLSHRALPLPLPVPFPLPLIPSRRNTQTLKAKSLFCGGSGVAELSCYPQSTIDNPIHPQATTTAHIHSVCTLGSKEREKTDQRRPLRYYLC